MLLMVKKRERFYPSLWEDPFNSLQCTLFLVKIYAAYFYLHYLFFSLQQLSGCLWAQVCPLMPLLKFVHVLFLQSRPHSWRTSVNGCSRQKSSTCCCQLVLRAVLCAAVLFWLSIAFCVIFQNMLWPHVEILLRSYNFIFIKIHVIGIRSKVTPSSDLLNAKIIKFL